MKCNAGAKAHVTPNGVMLQGSAEERKHAIEWLGKLFQSLQLDSKFQGSRVAHLGAWADFMGAV